MPEGASPAEDFETVTCMEEFAKSVRANFDQICEDLRTNVSAMEDCKEHVTFYGKKRFIGDTDEPLMLTGTKVLVWQTDPDFRDDFEEVSRLFNLYKTVEDYTHEEGSHATFDRVGDTCVEGVGFLCVLRAEYNYAFSDERCAEILGVDDKYGCCAVLYSFSVHFDAVCKDPPAKKQKRSVLADE